MGHDIPGMPMDDQAKIPPFMEDFAMKTYIYLGKLKYFTNLNLAAIWG